MNLIPAATGARVGLNTRHSFVVERMAVIGEHVEVCKGFAETIWHCHMASSVKHNIFFAILLN